MQKTIFKDISFIDFKVNPDKKIDFFIEDIALITLPIELILNPEKEKGQLFRPIQPICLLTDSIETKDDKRLETLQSNVWGDELIDFTIAGTYLNTH